MRPAALWSVARPARALVLAALYLLPGRPAALRAQAPTAPAATRRVQQAVAVNPIAIPLGGLSGEYERALGTAGFAFGAGATVAFDNGYSLSSADRGYASGQLKLKYYPSENGLRGFAVGATLGVVHGRDYVYEDYTLPCALPGCNSYPQPVLRGATAPTLGVVVDYNWLIGRRRRFLVGLGVGARRVLSSSADRRVLGDALPDGRFVVGYGF